MRVKIFSGFTVKELEAQVNAFVAVLEDGGIKVSSVQLSSHFAAYSAMVTYETAISTNTPEESE